MNVFRICRLGLTACAALFCASAACGQSQTMAKVTGGSYVPIYGSDSGLATVKSFYMDVYPVTAEQYAVFVKSNPAWRRSQVKKLFADGNYLAGWLNDTIPGKTVDSKAPVTGVSWFAATAYCKCQGKRLPTVDEWEYVAMADMQTADARKKETYNKFILSWYETPNTYRKTVGSTYRNYWGVWDLHGLVWEWTLDFNSVLISGESRKDSSNDPSLFCGSGSLGATDLMNYAAFMRYAFRGSVKSSYCIQNLGFRCVQDLPNSTVK